MASTSRTAGRCPPKWSFIRHEGDKTWMELTIREGRNQQIRRMGEATGFPVMRLARTSFAGISSEGLAPGRWRYMTKQELVELKKTYGVPKKIPHDLPEGGGEGNTTRRAEARRGGYGLGMAGRRVERDSDEQPEAITDRRRGRAAMPMRTTGSGHGHGHGGGGGGGGGGGRGRQGR